MSQKKRLPSVVCPSCHHTINSREFDPNARGGACTAQSFDSCLRQCESCGIGFSNANTDSVEMLTLIRMDPFVIRRDPPLRVPDSVVEGWEQALDSAANASSRGSKKQKFMSSKSEDHVTWTVFNYLRVTGQLGHVLTKAGIVWSPPARHRSRPWSRRPTDRTVLSPVRCRSWPHLTGRRSHGTCPARPS
jgi:hypothetical protein